jgi:hypothetical protein
LDSIFKGRNALSEGKELTILLKESLTDLKSKLVENGILLTFTGPFSQEIIEVLGEAIKKHIMSDENIRSNTLNVFSVFIEQTQNIRNYLGSKGFENEQPELLNSGMVAIGKTGDSYFVSSGNLSRKEDAQALVERIEEINGMDKAQLKAAYKSQMKKTRIVVDGEPGGAGLGLLEIARKASAPIEYSIISRNDRFDYITINVYI